MADFLSIDANAILKFPGIGGEVDEKIVWNWDDSGNFLVKSAYNLVINLELKAKTSCSDSVDEKFLWSKLWKIKLRSKIKIFFVETLEQYSAI